MSSSTLQRHPFHLVDPSPWPLFGSFAALTTTSGAVMWMHGYVNGGLVFSLGFISLLYTMFIWWRDVVQEGTYEGHHTEAVQRGLRWGMILFIVSEIMFFFAFFWAFFHSSISPAIEIGGIWPPKGIEVLSPWDVPLLNTLILLLSGASVTWAHHAILCGEKNQILYALAVTVVLAIIFTGFQGLEYVEVPFSISDGVY
jgi:cytochrome c oxidase subunit 3